MPLKGYSLPFTVNMARSLSHEQYNIYIYVYGLNWHFFLLNDMVLCVKIFFTIMADPDPSDIVCPPDSDIDESEPVFTKELNPKILYDEKYRNNVFNM